MPVDLNLHIEIYLYFYFNVPSLSVVMVVENSDGWVV